MKSVAVILFAALTVQMPAGDTATGAEGRSKSCADQRPYSSSEYGNYSPLAPDLPTI